MKNKYILYLFLGLYILALAYPAYADDWEQAYFEEEISYLVAYGKPFPEGTPFKCIKKDLWKNGYIVRDWNGIPIKCEFKTMTRREYEDLNNTSRTF